MKEQVPKVVYDLCNNDDKLLDLVWNAIGYKHFKDGKVNKKYVELSSKALEKSYGRYKAVLKKAEGRKLIIQPSKNSYSPKLYSKRFRLSDCLIEKIDKSRDENGKLIKVGWEPRNKMVLKARKHWAFYAKNNLERERKENKGTDYSVVCSQWFAEYNGLDTRVKLTKDKRIHTVFTNMKKEERATIQSPIGGRLNYKDVSSAYFTLFAAENLSPSFKLWLRDNDIYSAGMKAAEKKGKCYSRDEFKKKMLAWLCDSPNEDNGQRVVLNGLQELFLENGFESDWVYLLNTKERKGRGFVKILQRLEYKFRNAIENKCFEKEIPIVQIFDGFLYDECFEDAMEVIFQEVSRNMFCGSLKWATQTIVPFESLGNSINLEKGKEKEGEGKGEERIVCSTETLETIQPNSNEKEGEDNFYNGGAELHKYGTPCDDGEDEPPQLEPELVKEMFGFEIGSKP